MRKIAISFASVFFGWLAGFAYYLLYSFLLSPWGRPTDTEALLYWTAVFVVITWAILVLPVIHLLPASSALLRLPLAPLFGAASGLVAFLGFVGWWTGFWREALYLAYSVVLGVVTALAYVALGGLLRASGPSGKDVSDG